MDLDEPQRQRHQSTSSPLTDVHELREQSPSQHSDDSRRKRQRVWEEKQVEMYHKLQQNRKSDTTSEDKGLRRDSIASGQTTPLESGEEGVYLPDRKRPVPYSSVNQQDRSGRTLIFKYASRCDVESTEALLRAGASLRIADNAGWTPLHEACLEGHLEIVRLMLAFDADVDCPGGDGDTPLHDAVGNVHYEVVKLLLRHGASIDLVNEQGQTALEFAIEKLKAENKYDSPLKKSEAKQENDDSKKIVDLLTEWKDMTNKVVERDKSGQTLLHHACTEGNVERVLQLLEYGADIAAQDATKWTPLHNAALNGHANVVEVLLRYGADVDAVGFEDETPLHDAVVNGHLQCASLLLQYGAEQFCKNRDGKMPKDLVRPGDAALKELLDYPLEHWQPRKMPEFYARLVTPCDPKIIQEKKKSLEKTTQKQSAVKKHSQKAADHHMQNKNFAWGGLDDRAGPFESSREEKKFRALWQTIAKQDNDTVRTNGRSFTGDSPVVARGRQGSVDLGRPKMDKKRTSVPPEDTPSKKPKKDEVREKKRDEKPKEVKKPKPAEPTPKREVKSESRPPLKPTPPPTKKESPVVIKPIIIERKEEDAKKKKKRFAISGYQRAGENTEVSSESVVVSEDVIMRPTTPNLEPVIPIQPSKDVREPTPPSEQPKPPVISLAQFITKPEETLQKSPTKTEKNFPKEQDTDLKRSIRSKYCLPLCAYYKTGDSKAFPLPAAESSRWGMLQQNQKRLFLDIQLAICLGLTSGRQLLEKYPLLISRVATMAEKEALEATVVSSRLLKSMLQVLDRKWISTTIVEGEEAMKLTDLDIHLVSWTPELYQILKSHRIRVESKEKVDVDWIHDLKWPYEERKPVKPIEIPQKYVHKLKRIRS